MLGNQFLLQGMSFHYHGEHFHVQIPCQVKIGRIEDSPDVDISFFVSTLVCYPDWNVRPIEK